MRAVHVVVPGGVDDPTRPSGGNTYDRRVCTGLAELGWSVHLHPVAGGWPRPELAEVTALASVLAGLPHGSTVLVDGLVACCVPEVLVPATSRLSVVVLVHTPLGGLAEAGSAEVGGPEVVQGAERAVLSAVAAVVTTSDWTRRWLLDRYSLPPDRLQLAEPGAAAAAITDASHAGNRLLCVAAVAPGKGHDLLVAALAQVADLSWHCTCVGSVDLDPTYLQRVRREARTHGLADRLRFTGALAEDDLEERYAAADVLLLASRFETYGLVVTEALARGLPVVATSVGGVGEALGRAPDGRRPGLLVPGDDPRALADALRTWLTDHELRSTLRRAAQARRVELEPWSVTAGRIAEVLHLAGARP